MMKTTPASLQPASAGIGNALAAEAMTGAASKGAVSAWYGLAVLIATTLCAFVDRQILNLIAPILQQEFGLSDFQLGMLQGLAFVLFASAASYPIGWLADRYGRRLILACCIMLWSVSTAACAFQSSFIGLFIAKAGVAAGEAALTPIIFSMIPDLFPERQRNSANFVFFAAALLGAAAGFGLGGAMLDWLSEHKQLLPDVLAVMDTWRVAVILAAVPGMLLVLLLTTVRVTGASQKHVNDGEDGGRLVEFLPFIRCHWRTFTYIYGTIAAYGFAVNSSFAWMPVAIPRIFGTEPSEVGIQMGVAIAVAAIVGLAIPPLGLRFLPGNYLLKPFRMGGAMMAIALLPTLFMLVATSPWQIVAAAGVQSALGIATGAMMPGLLQQIAPSPVRSRSLAVLGIVSAISQGLAPLLVGALSGSFDGSRGVLAAIVIVAAPAWIIGAFFLMMAKGPFVTTAGEVREMEPE